MKKIFVLLTGALLCACTPEGSKDLQEREPQAGKAPEPLAVGYATSIQNFTPEKLTYAKSAGIDYVEASGLGLFVDGDRNFKMQDEEIKEILSRAKKAADEAGINIWSVHMPFGAHIDLSLTDEAHRLQVVALHKKLLGFLDILDPEIILFHPSYYLGLNERDRRKSQLIKSATTLNEAVQAIDARMVIENMLGFELMKDEHRERPLMRTVEECVEIMNRLPESIYSAIDMNHIKDPEKLIRAMGSRLKSVHIADGTGKAENHFFPCSGEGGNDWVAILSALHEAGYEGPFMYESDYKDEKDLTACYATLYQEFISKTNFETVE